MNLDTLHNALASPAGLVDVTKIELEFLPGGTFRWTAWDGARRVVSAPFKLDELPEYLSRTEIILETMHAQPPQRFLGEVTHGTTR